MTDFFIKDTVTCYFCNESFSIKEKQDYILNNDTHLKNLKQTAYPINMACQICGDIEYNMKYLLPDRECWVRMIDVRISHNIRLFIYPDGTHSNLHQEMNKNKDAYSLRSITSFPNEKILAHPLPKLRSKILNLLPFL